MVSIRNCLKWLGVALLLLTATSWATESTLKVGDTPPDFLGKDGKNNDVRVSDYRGKVMVISFFATWCGPCRNELPVLANLQKVAGRENIVVVAIDYKEDRDVVRKARNLLKEYDITFTHDYNGAIGKEFHVNGIPHMVIVGADGKVAAKHVGYSESSLDGLIDEINSAWRASLVQPSQ